ncbi:MAG: hypothetical protein HKN39_07510 [Flavobacteriales bacterium]|nr:hypothetical protein [Flavobacteriales bacterium]
MPPIKTTRLRPFIIAFKFLIFLAAIYVIYQKLSHSEHKDISTFLGTLFSSTNSLLVFLLVGAMSFLNWDLETRKWQILMKPYEQLEYSKAFRSVLAGSAVSFVSPNRSGSFIGRVLFLESRNRGQGTGMSILGGFAQTLVSLITGLLALSICLFPKNFIEHKTLIITLGIAASAVFFLLYFKSQWFARIDLKKTVFKEIAQPFQEIRNEQRIKVISLSVLRYLVFSLQFALLLSISSLQMPLMQLLLCVFIIYFIMGLLPSLWLGNLGPRELISIMVISSFYPGDLGTDEQFQVIWPSLVLWVVNLCIPALMGSFFLLAKRVRT